MMKRDCWYVIDCAARRGGATYRSRYYVVARCVARFFGLYVFGPQKGHFRVSR